MNIKFNSEQLTNYIGYKLDILDNEFTREQLNTLKELVLDYEYGLELEVLKYFNNLESLEIYECDWIIEFLTTAPSSIITSRPIILFSTVPLIIEPFATYEDLIDEFLPYLTGGVSNDLV